MSHPSKCLETPGIVPPSPCCRVLLAQNIQPMKETVVNGRSVVARDRRHQFVSYSRDCNVIAERPSNMLYNTMLAVRIPNFPNAIPLHSLSPTFAILPDHEIEIIGRPTRKKKQYAAAGVPYGDLSRYWRPQDVVRHPAAGRCRW